MTWWFAPVATSSPWFAAGLVPGRLLDRVLSQLSGGIYATTPRPADMPGGLHPSITIGAVARTRTPVTFDDLYQVADEALYVAKRAGKATGGAAVPRLTRLILFRINGRRPSSFAEPALAVL